MKNRLAIAIPGAMGMVTVVSTGGYYAGADGFAFLITGLMGAALAAGLWELWWLQGRTARLHGELSALPKQATDEDLDSASPILRALLRARLDRTALSVPGPIFTPYIIGLLVMLGLLGTFLGLFETLRGASSALTASADVEALRAGLRQPMQGLMRSFGTSATGVATSAMLGLAAVFTRRSGRQLGLALHEMASGPLARFSPAHRQLVALEALSAQGEAWPKAAGALRQATDKLDALRTTFAETQLAVAEKFAQSQAETTGAVLSKIQHTTDRLDGIQAAFAEGHSELTSATREQQAELVGAMELQIQATADSVDRASSRNEAAMLALSDRWQDAHQDALTKTKAALDATLNEVSTSVDRGVILAAERASQTLSPLLATAVEGTVTAATQHLDAVLSAVHADADQRRAAQADATDALEARVKALLEALSTLADERRRADQTQLSQFEEQTANLLVERSAADEALLKRLSDHLASYQHSRVEADAAALNRLDAHSSTVVEALEQHRKAQDDGISAQVGALSSHQAATLATLSEVRADQQQQQQALLDALAQEGQVSRSETQGQAKQLFAYVQQTLETLESFTSDAVGREKTRAEATAGMAEKITQDLANATALVRDRLQRSEEAEEIQQARSQALFTSLQAAATTIGDAAQNQVSALESFVDRTDQRLRETEGQAQGRLDTFVAALQQQIDAQQQRLSDFEHALRQAQQHATEQTQQQVQQTLVALSDFATQLRTQGEQAVGATAAEVRNVAEHIASWQADLDGRQQAATAAIQQSQTDSLAQLQSQANAAAQHLATFTKDIETTSGEAATALAQQLATVGQQLLSTEAELVTKHQQLGRELEQRADAQRAQLIGAQDALLEQHAGQVQSLNDAFARQLEAMEQRLADNTALVTEAAQLVSGGGAELITVAETFGAAVEQQRQGAQQWLESLGDIERSVTTAGEAAAADVLGQHLARTHEVFDRQLRFQQELMEQLHSAPSSTRPASTQPVAMEEVVGEQVNDARA